MFFKSSGDGESQAKTILLVPASSVAATPHHGVARAGAGETEVKRSEGYPMTGICICSTSRRYGIEVDTSHLSLQGHAASHLDLSTVILPPVLLS